MQEEITSHILSAATLTHCQTVPGTSWPGTDIQAGMKSSINSWKYRDLNCQMERYGC